MSPHLRKTHISLTSLLYVLNWFLSLVLDTCMRKTWFILVYNVSYYFYRFLQGPETDPATVRKIREAIDNQTEVTVQLINYTKSGL